MAAGLNAKMNSVGSTKGSGKSSVKSSKVSKPVMGGGKVTAPMPSQPKTNKTVKVKMPTPKHNPNI